MNVQDTLTKLREARQQAKDDARRATEALEQFYRNAASGIFEPLKEVADHIWVIRYNQPVTFAECLSTASYRNGAWTISVMSSGPEARYDTLTITILNGPVTILLGENFNPKADEIEKENRRLEKRYEESHRDILDYKRQLGRGYRYPWDHVSWGHPMVDVLGMLTMMDRDQPPKLADVGPRGVLTSLGGANVAIGLHSTTVSRASRWTFPTTLMGYTDAVSKILSILVQSEVEPDKQTKPGKAKQPKKLLIPGYTLRE